MCRANRFHRDDEWEKKPNIKQCLFLQQQAQIQTENKTKLNQIFFKWRNFGHDSLLLKQKTFMTKLWLDHLIDCWMRRKRCHCHPVICCFGSINWQYMYTHFIVRVCLKTLFHGIVINHFEFYSPSTLNTNSIHIDSRAWYDHYTIGLLSSSLSSIKLWEINSSSD